MGKIGDGDARLAQRLVRERHTRAECGCIEMARVEGRLGVVTAGRIARKVRAGADDIRQLEHGLDRALERVVDACPRHRVDDLNHAL
jgi:hypothetical protein